MNERAAAFGSFLAYAGSFTVVDGVVTHELEISLFPNWVGTKQVRYASFDGDHLVLSAPPPYRWKVAAFGAGLDPHA